MSGGAKGQVQACHLFLQHPLSVAKGWALDGAEWGWVFGSEELN